MSEILILGLFLIWYTCKKATILELETDCFQESLTLLRKWLLTNLTILKITIVLRNIPESRLDDICCPVKLLRKIIFFSLRLNALLSQRLLYSPTAWKGSTARGSDAAAFITESGDGGQESWVDRQLRRGDQ